MTRLRTGPVVEEIELRKTPKHTSFSQLMKLMPTYRYACPRQYAYGYLAGLPQTSSISLVLGNALDGAMNLWNTSLIKARRGEKIHNMTVEELADVGVTILDQEIGTRTFSRPVTEAQRDMAADMARKIIIAVVQHEVGRTPAAVQTRHEYWVPSSTAEPASDGTFDDDDLVHMVGFSDKIEDDGVIVDYKVTGRAPWGENGWGDNNERAQWIAEKNDQVGSYWISRLAEQRRGEPQTIPVVPRGRLTVAYAKIDMKEPKVASLDLTFTAGDIWRILTEIQAGDAIKREGRFPARPGEACSFCSFVVQCRQHEWDRGTAFHDLIVRR